MRSKKPLLLITFLAIFSFLFNFNISTTKAVADEELQTLTIQLKEEILQLQERILQLQTQLNQIQQQLIGEEEEEVPVSCHTVPLWDWHYCSSVCQCQAGEGDCDSNLHCKTGYCALDVGAKYGQDRWIDVCEEKEEKVTLPPEKKVSEPEVKPSLLTCSDSDWFGADKEGLKKRLAKKGTCQDTTGSYSDVCVKENLLRDYYCDKTCVYTTYNCQASGFTACQNGACVKEGNLSFSLATDTPEAKTIFAGANNVTFLRVQFVVNEEEDIKINSLKVSVLKNQNLSAGSIDISNLKLYDDSAQIGLIQTTLIDGWATFTDLNLTISKSSSKVLSIGADIPINTSALTLRMEISSGADIEAVGMSFGASILTSGSAIGNTMTISSSGYLLISLSSDTPDSTTIAADTADAPILKFNITNLLAETVSVEKLSVKLEGEAQPSDFGSIYWRLADDTLLGASYFGQVASSYGFASISNPPTYEKGETVQLPLFEVAPQATIGVRVLADIEFDAADGRTFQFSMPQEFYLTTTEGYSVVGFPIESEVMTIAGALCTDSDGGINEYVFGKTTKSGVTRQDACFLGDNLKEWVCTAAGEETYKLIECEYGCVDGVCKQLFGNDETTGVVCIDSDAGKDYETYGKVTHGTGSLIDSDTCDSETTLKENYCQNGYFAQESYQCPTGCQNGACLSQTGLKNMENSLTSISEAVSQLMEKIKEMFGQ